MDAAVDLFARQGYDRTSLRQIAGAVSITESAVYRHYPSKEAILDEIIAYMETQVSGPPGEYGGDGGPSIFRRKQSDVEKLERDLEGPVEFFEALLVPGEAQA